MPLQIIFIFCALNVFEIVETNVPISSVISTKIIGGEIVRNREEFPAQVSVRLRNLHSCAGSIINGKFVLSAAHCYVMSFNHPMPPSSLSVVAGTLNIRHFNNSTVIRKVEKIILHESYNDGSIFNDIALLKISGTFEPWTRYISAIKLPKHRPNCNASCTVCGWGVMKFNTSEISYHLRSVNVPIVPLQYCKLFYEDNVNNKMICAGSLGRDTCQGDSGGPLICDGEVAGISSWGHGCGDVFPGVYTAVAEYQSWIIKQLENSSHSLSTYFLCHLLSLLTHFAIRRIY